MPLTGPSQLDATSTGFIVAFEFEGGAGGIGIGSVTSTWGVASLIPKAAAPLTSADGANTHDN